ncbi:MAG: histidine phosphatase family protein [Pseudomonadota bacterium]
MTRFWWVRHAPTHVKAMVGWVDVPADLSDAAQIARLSDYLPQRAIMVASDLSRASKTADALAKPDRSRLPDDPTLREINFGVWDGRAFDDVDKEAPVLLRKYWDQPGDVRPPEGESWNEVCARVNSAADALAHRYDEMDVIVVAHFGVVLTQVQRALGISPLDAFGYKIHNLSVTVTEFDGTWRAGIVNHVP